MNWLTLDRWSWKWRKKEEIFSIPTVVRRVNHEAHFQHHKLIRCPVKNPNSILISLKNSIGFRDISQARLPDPRPRFPTCCIIRYFRYNIIVLMILNDNMTTIRYGETFGHTKHTYTQNRHTRRRVSSPCRDKEIMNLHTRIRNIMR